MEVIEEKRKVSVEEYLAMEEQAEYRSEYYEGEILAMSGASLAHNLISVNTAASLHTRLSDKDCLVVSTDMRLAVDEARSYVYPDVMVICGEPEFSRDRKDLIKNPLLIVEVLSPSTELYDRGKKFHTYRKLESFKEYILISQDSYRVERFYRRDKNVWLMELIEGIDARLKLSSLGLEIPLSDIYKKVQLNKDNTAS